MKYVSRVNDREYVIEIDQEGRILVDDEPYNIDFEQLSEGGIISLLINSRSLEAIVEERDEAWEVLIQGELYTVQVQDERSYRLARARATSLEVAGEAVIKSPMPGVIIAVPVSEGQVITKGEKVVILESMKMENELRSPRDGIVKHVYVAEGANVEKGQVLATIGDPS